jgi:hypothetical protein
MQYVIEHAARGVYVGTDMKGKPIFKLLLRSEGQVFKTEEAALRLFKYIQKRHPERRAIHLLPL